MVSSENHCVCASPHRQQRSSAVKTRASPFCCVQPWSLEKGFYGSCVEESSLRAPTMDPSAPLLRFFPPVVILGPEVKSSCHSNSIIHKSIYFYSFITFQMRRVEL